MGNELTSNTNSGTNTDFHNYIVLKKTNLEGLGLISICKDPVTNKSYFLLETNYSIPNEEMAKSDLQQQMQLNDIKNLSPVIKSDIVKDQLLCFDNYSMKILFNDYEKSFEQRITNNYVIQEDDAWVVIGDLFQYLCDLESLGITNGDLQPKYIQFDDNEIVQVLSPLIYTSYQNAYKYRLANDAYLSAYSPELLEQFNHRIQFPNYDPIKSDIFSMGISLLSLLCGEHFGYFYEFKENRVLFDRVKIKIAQIVKDLGYSEKIFYFLDLCLKEDANQRANLNQLAKILKKSNPQKKYGY